ncbi:MAG: 5-bromo-4-chloroindolyl phosphate hydrolysis family protein [Desulfamplus sp.]|nr:5-bromo-4-chloroindolyl phosphate hydrolysis family protein [Desulfamplus sp.]
MFIKHYEIWSGLIAASILLFGVFVLQTPLWLNFVVAISLFAGLFMIGSFWIELQIGQEAKKMTQESMSDKILKGKKKLNEIRAISKTIHQPTIRQQIVRICDLGDRIFKGFDEEPHAVSGASRFLLYIDRILPYVEKYAKVSSTRTGTEMIKKDGEILEVLNSLEQGFEQGFKNYLEKDVVELKTVGRVLKKMMSVAEIGK